MRPAWTIEFSPGARKAIKQLDRQAAARIVTFLEQRLATARQPRELVLVVRIGHRREVYR